MPPERPSRGTATTPWANTNRINGPARNLAIATSCQPGVRAAVEEVDREAYDQPDHETDPGLLVQEGHEVRRGERSRRSHEPYKRCLERPRQVGLPNSQHQNPAADDHKREQGPDRHQLGCISDWKNGGRN